MSPINVLYVEDNDDIRDMVLELIQSEHLRCVSCANAEDAWLLLQPRQRQHRQQGRQQAASHGPGRRDGGMPQRQWRRGQQLQQRPSGNC